MEEKYLIIHMPVIHKGYVDFLEKIQKDVSGVFIIDEKFLEELSEFKPDIASLSADKVKNLLEKLGFNNISILYKEKVNELNGKDIIFIQDEISRNLADKYFKNNKIQWESVFLRWGKDVVLVNKTLDDMTFSRDSFDIDIMKQASAETAKSSEWWRRIGAVLVQDKKIILKAYNKDLPSDHTPYQVGEVRDLFNTGERSDLASTIHAEQSIIAQAAKEGISIKGLSLYVTTFPCPVCAKLIAYSGIKKLYFAEGWSNFDARKVLESAGVKITNVPVTD